MIEEEKPDAETLQFLRCVFPSSLADAEYLPLLYILRQDMTIRAASGLVSILLSKSYLNIYNDALGVYSKRHVLDEQIIDKLKQRLYECGYEDWLDS